MPTPMEQLRALEKQLFAYTYAACVINYDDATVAPPESSEGRGEALEALSAAEHQLLTGSGLPGLLKEARKGAPGEQEAAELRELERMYDEASKIPAEEYAAFAKLTSTAQNVWAKARAADDFDAFAPYLQEILDTRRRWAGYLAPEKDPYDYWLDHYERGANTQMLDRFFDELQSRIVPLLARIRAEGKPIRTDFLCQDWPLAQQKELAHRVMRRMGVDADHCAMGESAHPFTTEFYKGDVRITTHYNPRDMTSSLYSVVHESGHALYELHTADRLKYTVLAHGASMGVHESQSRFYENYLGRSLAFIRALWPDLTELFPQQLAGVSPEELYAAVNRAEPGLIRTEADELTYCLHILVRYQIEKRLMAGELAVKDLPKTWNRLMKEILGVDVPNNAQGCLQDIHWSCGDLGYFPSYALGSAYGAQMLRRMKQTLDPDTLMEAGDFAPVNAWLCEHIWQYGMEKEPGWLVQNACGGPFDPACFAEYLETKYAALYGLA